MSGDAQGDWAALVGSRLCHDLVSPLGAIGNGLELLRMTQPASPELDLLSDAADSAQARLKLFRLAFGAAPSEQTVTGAVLHEALLALGERIEIRSSLPDTLGQTLPRAQAKRLLLAALCAESALAWGGALDVAQGGLWAEARRLRLDPDLWGPLSMGRAPADPAPAAVQFALLAASGPVTVDITDTTLAIRL